MIDFLRILPILCLFCMPGCSEPTLPTSSEPTATKAAVPPIQDTEVAAKPPSMSVRSIFRPTFAMSDRRVSAGTAFVVSVPSQKRFILLSALHLLGPAGGLEEQIQAIAVPTTVTRLTLEPCFIHLEPIELEAEALPITDAAPHREASAAGDVVAFWVPPGAKVAALNLATDRPKPGTRVWLAAPAMINGMESVELHGATVSDVKQAGLLFYDFDKGGLALGGSSGAPVLNSNGEVVAINLAGGAEAGRMFGAGNPVDRFRPFLLATQKGAGAR